MRHLETRVNGGENRVTDTVEFPEATVRIEKREGGRCRIKVAQD